MQLNEDALCELEQRAAATVQRNAVMKMKMDNRFAVQDNVSEAREELMKTCRTS